nr:glycosyltransferase family 9 protein [Candidatus Neomarinimicrobiota bacterium]
PDTMRLIDRWAGIPLCFVTGVLSWIKSTLSPKSENYTKTYSPEIIIFIGLAEIGALVVAYPAIQEARKQYPNSRVCFITGPAGFQTLELMGFEKEEILLMSMSSLASMFLDLIRIRKNFSGKRVSAIVLEPFTRISALLTVWIGASQRIGCHRFFNEGSYIGNFLTHRLVFNPHLHASQTYFALSKALCEPVSIQPLLKEKIPSQMVNRLKINIQEDDQKVLQNRLKLEYPETALEKILLLNANASDIVPLRKWPMDRFVELGRKLLENSSITIILTGSQEEKDVCEDLALQINPDRTVNFAGKTSFKELITLYSISDLLITNDSGPVHFASTTEIPILALFGPGSTVDFRPMSPNAKVISLELACSPCVSVFNQKKSSCDDNQCMKQISVQMVVKETQKILGK